MSQIVNTGLTQPADISEAVLNAAFAADLAGRDPRRSWTAVPPDQARRLIAGALNALTGLNTVPFPMDDPELVAAMTRWAMSKGAIITRSWFGLPQGLPPAGEKTGDQETTP
jgi:hypothetical protein